MGFRSGDLVETRPWPPAAPDGTKKPTVSLSLVGKAEMNGKPVPVQPVMSDTWYRLARETYLSSGLFSEIRPSGNDADVRAEIEVMDTGSGSMVLAIICGLTLTLVPSRAEDDFDWKTTFKDRAGSVRGTIQKKEGAIMWIEFFLLFGMPLGTPKAVSEEVIRDLNRSTILDAQEKGYLRP